MGIRIISLFICFWAPFFSLAEEKPTRKLYQFLDDPIDVVIPAVSKDLTTLNLCIEGIKKNCCQIRRIIVVSPEPLTDQAEWFDEKNFPFDKQQMIQYMLDDDEFLIQLYQSNPACHIGWYYQQLLKLYAPFVIPDISSNVLSLDSDTVVLNPVEFLNESHAGLYNPGSEYNTPYFLHGERLLPGFKRIFPEFSGISHHMIFQKAVLEDLFDQIKKIHQTEPWIAFCKCVARSHINSCGFSEYEIYFNFVFSRTDQVSIRFLKWMNSSHLDLLEQYRNLGYHYVSFHSHMRE